MPHSGKKITPSPVVGGRASSSRGASWTKYGGAAGADEHTGVPTEISVVIDDITVVQTSDPQSKYDERPSSAVLVPADDTARPVQVKRSPEWVSDRTVEDRTYRRHDELTTVVVEG